MAKLLIDGHTYEVHGSYVKNIDTPVGMRQRTVTGNVSCVVIAPTLESAVAAAIEVYPGIKIHNVQHRGFRPLIVAADVNL